MTTKKSKPAYDGRSRKLARKKALEVIETISIHKEEDEDWTLVYMLAHVALGRCGNPHESWDKQLNELWEELRGNRKN